VLVPLVLVTGFLGSGKTTLVNRILARRAARNDPSKLGVIVNELGEVGIDGALLTGASTRQVELPGGCVCCVLGDELDTTLIELVDANPLTAIVLETTGVAEPLPIAWALRRAPIDERVRLAIVVTLVDATTFLSSRALSASVDSQVAYADVVLVTKAEIAGDHDTDAAIAAVRSLAPRALIRRGTTDEHASWLEQALADPPIDQPSTSLEAPVASPDGQAHVHVHDENCRHPDASAAHGIDSVWVPVQAVVDLEELEDQLAELPANYVRIKGIFRATDARGDDPTARWTAIHRVGLRVSSEPVATPDFEEGRLVALGPAVDVEVLARCVRAAS
jgi:G3E family GTPase